MRIFGKGKCKLIANFSSTMVMSLPSFSLCISLCLTERTSRTRLEALPRFLQDRWSLGARRPPMKDKGTETAFRLDQCKHFRKSKHLLRSEVNRCDQSSIELHLRRSTSTSYCMVSRSINMLSVTDFDPKGIISGVRVQAGLYLDMLDGDRSPNAVSVHAGTSQVDFEVDRPPPAPPGHLLITMVKEAVFCTKNEFRKMKKSRISH